MSAIPNKHLNPNDKYIGRDRVARFLFLAAYVVIILLLLPGFGRMITNDLFEQPAIGFFIGLFGALYVFSRTLDRFFVSVEVNAAFLTVDLWQTLFGGQKKPELPTPDVWAQFTKTERARDRKIFPVYLTGYHPAFPWEARDRENNVSLKEVSESFETTIQLKDGEVNLDGSFRLRPDYARLIPFLGGAATSATELRDLIVAFIVEYLSDKTVDEALECLEELNGALMKEFTTGKVRDSDNDNPPSDIVTSGRDAGEVSKSDESSNAHPATNVVDFERRFGVYVGDVTIGKILQSEAGRKTKSALNEAQIVAKGTAVLLGYANQKTLKAAVKAGRVSKEQVRLARDRFLSISGNLEGMELRRYEVDISGIEPEVASALTALATTVNNVAGGRSQQPRRRSSRKGKKNG